MTKPMLLLRSLLFLPAGDPARQDQEVRELETSLRQSHDRIRAARIESNKTAELKSLFNEVLEKLK